jgi:hypothetical protein
MIYSTNFDMGYRWVSQYLVDIVVQFVRRS